jgi:Ni2+-binding GTPase involved in maturation of urease and hydrogenase
MDEKEGSGHKILVGVVGPCGSGKTTLIAGLEREGIRCRHIAQEHSYVPTMWKRITNPDLLIYLNSSFEVCTQRRKLNWNEAEYQEQLHRLEHARQNADLIIDTDHLLPEQVLRQALGFIQSMSERTRQSLSQFH